MFDFLGITPQVTEPLDLFGIIWRFFLVSVLCLIIALIDNFINDEKISLAGKSLIAILTLFPIFDLYRHTEGFSWFYWIVTLFALGINIGTSLISTKFGGYGNYWSVIFILVTIFIATIFDKLNEVLGSIPMSWGAFIAIVVLGLAYVSDSR